MSRIALSLACLLLSSAAVAQNAAAPANVVVPPPPPQEGTVGPEQLRDFALPGTARPAPTPREDPAPVATPTPSPAADRPASSAPGAQPAVPRQAPETPTLREAPVAASPVGEPLPGAAATAALATPTLPLPPLGEPPLSAPAEGSATGLPWGWWPWLLVAVLAGIGLALLVRRRRLATAGYRDAVNPPWVPAEPEPASSKPAVPLAFTPPADPPPSERPQGLVTTKLRPARAPVADPVPAPAPAGGIVSRRLRPWIDLDLAVREILLTEVDAILRFDLMIVNGGAAPARAVVVEAVSLNAGERQGEELRTFFERSPSTTEGIAEIPPMGTVSVSHELRMPREAIRAYEAQGRTLFVPVLAFTATYRAGSVEGRTGAAYLVGRHNPASDRLAPLQLDTGPRRLFGLAVRRLEDAVRR